MEADTVAHCGTSLMGDFVWSITLTDIFSGGQKCVLPGTKERLGSWKAFKI